MSEHFPIKETLEDCVSIFEDRNSQYKCGFIKTGNLLDVLFPDGIHLEGPEEQARFANLQMMIGKLVRYCDNFETGHSDSLKDMINYTAIQSAMDQRFLEEK